MKSLLFALGLALCCLVQAEPFAKFDHSKINTHLYSVAIATDCQKLKKMLPQMKATPITFQPQSPDKIKTIVDMATQNGCHTITPVFERTDGVFTTSCGEGSVKTMEEIEAQGKAVFISMNVSHKKGECKLVSLLVSDLADAQAAMAHFIDFVARAGLASDDIQILSTDGMCPRSS